MRNVRMWAGLGIAVTGMVVAAAGVSGREAAVQLVPECEVTVAAERVPIQADPVIVPVRHSAPLGEAVEASIAEDSGASVTAIARNEEDEPQTLRLTLNTSEATAGEWGITLTDGEQQCTGTVTLATPETR